VIRALGIAALHGRWCLVFGLIAGLTLPGLARFLSPYLPEMIALLLFLAALRIGPRATLGNLRDVGHTLGTVVIYQLFAPIFALFAALIFGVAGTAAGLAMVLVLAAPSVTGAPNFTILMGRDPAAPMRLLLVGTAAFPLTVVPVLWLLPEVPTIGGAIEGALRLLFVIFSAVGIAFAIRHWLWPELPDRHRAALDGASAILLGIVVIGLMFAVGPAISDEPLRFALWLGFAFILNFGLQLIAATLMPVASPEDRAGTAIVAGNRNIALFLVALPEPVMAKVLLFIGCYQVPMYLTPILMRRFLAHD
jgi:ACR3 family arsenite transporter